MSSNNRECSHNHNSSGNGFMMGVMVGVGLTLLFTTEKGRKILKELSDEGLSKLGEFVDLEETASDEGSFDEVEETEVEESSPKKRRLFRGIRKR